MSLLVEIVVQILLARHKPRSNQSVLQLFSVNYYKTTVINRYNLLAEHIVFVFQLLPWLVLTLIHNAVDQGQCNTSTMHGV